MAAFIDRAYNNKDFSNADKKKLADIVGELSHELVFLVTAKKS